LRLARTAGFVSGLTSSRATWYLTRGTGATALVLLTIVTVLGVANMVRWTPAATQRFVIQRLHRNLSLLAVVFVAIHVASAVIDGFAPIRWIDAVIPFRSAYRPLWLGFGAVAFDLMIAIIVTSLLRAHLGYSAWRVLHWLSYGLWVSGVFHGLGIGSDTTQPWMLALAGVSIGAVLAAVLWRIAVGWRQWTPGRAAMVLGAISVPVVLGTWFLAGPMQPGWAARAGTPSTLLPHPISASASTAPARPPLVLPSQGTASGTTTLRRLDGGLARVDIAVRTQGITPLGIHVILHGQALEQGISLTDGSVVLTPPQGAVAYRGSVTGLSGGEISAAMSDGHGDQIDLLLSLQIASSGRTQGAVGIRTVARQTDPIS
jgi:sulfoxide reductase heme-binding subunit YedZ